MSTPFDDFLKSAHDDPPRFAFVLGSGLGDLAQRLADVRTIPFLDLPDIPAPTVHGHRGELHLGRWIGRRVLVFAGRVHYYEGHPWRSVVQPVHLAQRLGARTLILTNAVGGIRADLGAGSLVVLRDHIECTRPLWWRSLDAPRTSPYSPRLNDAMIAAAGRCGQTLTTGVYAQVTGPSYETPAEVRALRACGADVVGMSTAREIQTGHDLGLECAAISCVCNPAAGLSDAPIDHHDVLKVAAVHREQLTSILEAFLAGSMRE